MIRRKYGRSLSRGINDVAQEDVDPNSSLSAVGDCMLVLAVGLLVALVAHYGVALTDAEEISQGEQVDPNDLGIAEAANGEEEGNFYQLGTVYQDAETGELYMVTEEEVPDEETADSAKEEE